MPTTGTPVNKQVRIKKESTWGVAPGASGAQLLRRVSSDLDLQKQKYSSNEVRSDRQRADMRHGVRSVEGGIQGELSPLTYEMLFVAILAKAWAATTSMTGLSITVAGSGPTYTLTRGSGSFLTDGVKIGDVVRPTVALNSANLINLLVVNVTATVLTVIPLNGAALTAEGPIAGTTITVPGKRTWVPASGHTDDSFSIEHWFSDISQSELFLGCKVKSITVNLPASGMATIAVQFLGQDLANQTQRGGAALTVNYYTSPTAVTTSGILAAVNGVCRYGSGSVANITSLSFTIDAAQDAEPVIGSNVYPDIFEGPITVKGQFTALFQDATYRDAFRDETKASITMALTTNNTGTADFLSFTMSNVKLGGANKGEAGGGTGPVSLTVPFEALKNEAGGTGLADEATTILVQDSLAP